MGPDCTGSMARVPFSSASGPAADFGTSLGGPSGITSTACTADSSEHSCLACQELCALQGRCLRNLCSWHVLGGALGVTSAPCAYPCVKHFSWSLGHAASLYVESKILLSRHPQNVLRASPALRAYITSCTLQLQSQAVRGMDHASVCIKQALQGCQACMSPQALTRLQGLAASRVSLFPQEHSWACEA